MTDVTKAAVEQLIDVALPASCAAFYAHEDQGIDHVAWVRMDVAAADVQPLLVALGASARVVEGDNPFDITHTVADWWRGGGREDSLGASWMSGPSRAWKVRADAGATRDAAWTVFLQTFTM